VPQEYKYSFKKILGAATWTLLGFGTVILLVAAMKQKNISRCHGVEIKINGVQNNFFIDKSEVMRFLVKTEGKPEGRPTASFNLFRMEVLLEKNEWIKNAELFFDNNEKLIVNIQEREPVARIFADDGSSFYIDSTTKKLNLSEKFSAWVPVFTNFPIKNTVRSIPDSTLLAGIKNLGGYIVKDAFWMAQIDQVNITAEKTFEIIPKIGNQLIIFGTSENFKEKFDNLLIFYKNVESKVGWNKYSQINVAFRGQVIAVKRGAEDIKMDSLKTIQLMKTLAANAQKIASDTLNNIQLVQPQDDNNMPVSTATDENIPDEQSPGVAGRYPGNTTAKIKTPIISTHVAKKPTWQPEAKSKPAILKKVKFQIFKSFEEPNPPLKKPAPKQVIGRSGDKPKEKPKAVMQPNNDY
jgi:cell division protein FtsQ